MLDENGNEIPDTLPEPEPEIIEDDEAEILALVARIDELETKNSELTNEITRAHERCRVLEDRLNSGDSLPKSVHPWFRKIGE